jgi:topoisomerase-4 subunit B
MNPPELWETTLCPETRVLRQITPLADAEDVALTEGVFDNLMAGNKSGWRREWLERRGNELGAFNR